MRSVNKKKQRFN